MLLQFIFGIFYASLIEYLIHKYLFHKLGMKKDSIFSFHLRGHHLIARKNSFVDIRVSWLENIGIFLILLLHLPLYFVIPHSYIAMTIYGILFILIHNIIHRYPKFARKYYWWHWNHHMKNQNKSWNVVLPLIDIMTGTLEPRKRPKKIHIKK